MSCKINWSLALNADDSMSMCVMSLWKFLIEWYQSFCNCFVRRFSCCSVTAMWLPVLIYLYPVFSFAAIINPFAMTTNTRTQSPATNLFATRAQQEEQSRRVPINQMPTSGFSSSPVPPMAGGAFPVPLMPGGVWPNPTATPANVGMYAQPYVQPGGFQPYPTSQNPFLWIFQSALQFRLIYRV